jgi:RimJ/RimL family protein N-acetyltransferase
MTCLETLPPTALRERLLIVLETQRLVLRAPQLEDAKAIAALANDRRIAENTARIPHPYRVSDAESWIVGSAADLEGETYLITLANGSVIGGCGFDMRDGAAEIGYWLGTRHWGKGYATEAVRALIDHAFTNTEHKALQSSVRVTNPASRRVLEKCGFQWTGVGLLRVRTLGASVPSDRFRLDRRTWVALRAWGRTRLPVRNRAARG